MKSVKQKLKVQRILGFLLLFCALRFALYASAADRPSPPPPTPIPPSYTLTQKIQEGMALLQNSPALVYQYKTVVKKKKLVKTNDLLRKQIAVALLDTNTGGIFEKRVWVYEDEVKRYRKSGFVHFEPVAADESVDLQPQQWNSFNTFFTVVDRPELIVVADKYLLESKYLTGLPEKASDKYTEIYYAPYSTALHQPELIAAGRQYVNQKVNQAFADLSARGLPPGVSQDFIKNIILVEHVDPDAFALAADGGQQLTERVLAIIGANGDHAYRYTGSPAGASGLAQFIRPTYHTVAQKYPVAQLLTDYNQGMADHVNAVKAMVLFFDAYKKEITAKVTDPAILQQLGITEEMLAATYNGGVNRVTKSINKFGVDWLAAQIGLPKKQRTIATETLNYLKKFLAIRELGVLK